MISTETQTAVPIEDYIERAQSYSPEIRDPIIANLRRNQGNFSMTDPDHFFEGADGVASILPLVNGLRDEVQARLEAGWTYRGVLESDLSKLAENPLGVRQEVYGKLEPPAEEEDLETAEPGEGRSGGRTTGTGILVSRPLDSPRPVRQQQRRRPQRLEPLWPAPENVVTPAAEPVTEAAGEWRTIVDRLVSMRARSDDPRARLDLVAGLEHKTRPPDETIAVSESRMSSHRPEDDSVARERTGADRATETVLPEAVGEDASGRLVEELTDDASGSSEQPDIWDYHDRPTAGELLRVRTDESARSVPTGDDESAASEIPAEDTDTPLAYPTDLVVEAAPPRPMAASDAPEWPFDQEHPPGLESGSDLPLATVSEPLENEALPEPEAFTPEDSLDSTTEPFRLEQPAIPDESDRNHTFIFPERFADDCSDPELGQSPELLIEPVSQADRTSETAARDQDNRLVGESGGRPGETVLLELPASGPVRLSPAESEPDELPTVEASEEPEEVEQMMPLIGPSIV